MPNGEQALEQAQEGEDSAEDSVEWDSQGSDEEEESEESDEEEEVDSLPRSERRSKQQHDPVGGRGSECWYSEAHSDVDSGADGEDRQAAQGCSSQGSEDFVADQDGRPCGFGVSITFVLCRPTEISVLTDWIMYISSPTSAATNMDTDKALGDEEATSRVGKSIRPGFLVE